MIVVSGDAAIANCTAAKASMHDDLLAIAAEPGANWFHQTPAIAHTVAGCVAVDVPLKEA